MPFPTFVKGPLQLWLQPCCQFDHCTLAVVVSSGGLCGACVTLSGGGGGGGGEWLFCHPPVWQKSGLLFAPDSRPGGA